MSTKRLARFAAVTAATGGLAGGLLAATTVAAQADQNADSNQFYDCGVIVSAPQGDINLGQHVVGVNTVAVLPDTYTPGETIPSRQVTINLTLDEGLRAATYNSVGGRSVEGGSTNTFLGLRNSGQTSNVPLVNLKSDEPTDIPGTAGTPWIVPATGTVPPVPVPAQASGPTQVLAPVSFTVDASIYRQADGAGDPIPAEMTCEILGGDTPGNRRIGVIPEEGDTTPSVAPQAEEIATSTAPGTPVDITLAAQDSDSADTDLGYQVDQPANGTVTGAGDEFTYTPDNGFVGTDSFTYTVSDQSGNTDTATVTVEVEKAASTTKASAPKKAKPGKAVKVKVTVVSTPKASGPVTVKLGSKTVGKGTVTNGSGTATISKKATKKLKGKETFTVVFGGSATVEGSSAKVKVTFKK